MKRREFVVCGCALGLECTVGRTSIDKGERTMVYEHISACGIDCRTCDIMRLPHDQKVQDKILPWFRSNKWLAESEGIKEAIEKRMYCKGCNVDQDYFWSKGCKLARCCLDDKKLKNCSECDTFPCAELVEWSRKDERYTTALNYLTQLKQERR